ncbi:Uncharacterised protein [Mycobacteroides abscessus subsp. abscessus]|nr:Uncharacterised protein [Mycobacteroides abscessus subsp. abscessus]
MHYLLKIMINLDVFLLGEMIQSIGLNLLLAMQWYISYNKAHLLFIKVKKLV